MLLIPSIVALFIFFIISFAFFNKKIISNFASIESEIKILLFTFVSFAFLGLYDDLKKIFFWKKDYFFGIRLRHKLILEIILSAIISLWIFFELKIDFINIPFFGVYHISYFYILFSIIIITAFANAVNITDGLDGLASGLLVIALFAFSTLDLQV